MGNFHVQKRKQPFWVLSRLNVCCYNFKITPKNCHVLAELGDYSPDEHKDNYLDNFQVVPHQSASLTRLVAQFHRHHTGHYPADAEFKFLEVAKTLPLYGFDLYEAKVKAQM